jgi:hypothetical protein
MTTQAKPSNAIRRDTGESPVQSMHASGVCVTLSAIGAYSAFHDEVILGMQNITGRRLT